MARTPQELEDLISRGAVEKTISYMMGASDAERQSVAATAERWLKETSKIEKITDKKEGQLRELQRAAARRAVIASCSISTFKSLGWRVQPIDADAIRILADRKPTWMPELVDELLGGDVIAWVPVRALMRAGLIAKPTQDNYFLGMTDMHGGVGGMWSVTNPKDENLARNWTLLTHFEAEPDLLDDVWRLFEIEGSGEHSLAAHDKYTRQSQYRWDWTLIELSKIGKLPRERLLDASLSALDRGFAQFRSGWFSAFHEQLQPTLEERQQRIEQYLRLLSSPIPPTVTFALAALETADQASTIDSTAFAQALRPVMLSRAKGTVKTGLKLLEKIANRDKTAAALVARVAAEALIHEASDTQAAAMKLIAKTGRQTDADLVDSVKRAADTVAASVRKSVADWLRQAQPSSPQGSAKSVQAPPPSSSSWSLGKDLQARIAAISDQWRTLAGLGDAIAAYEKQQARIVAMEFHGNEFPRLDPDRAISPVQSIEDLIDLAARIIENPVDADEIERLYDGVSRLCDQKDGEFAKRTGPLLKRVRDLIKRNGLIPFTGHDPAADLMGVLISWLTGGYGQLNPIQEHGRDAVQYVFEDFTYSFPNPNRELLGGSLALRARQLADRVSQGTATATLCAPTHEGGWIDSRVLVARVKDRSVMGSASDYEMVLSLLRLAPDHRDEALANLSTSKGEFVAALRYALGAATKKLGSTEWLWVAASRARNPFVDDAMLEQQFPGLGPDAGTVARPHFVVTTSTYHKYVYHQFRIEVEPQPARKQIDPRLLTVLLWKHPDHRLGPEFVSMTAVSQLFQICPLGLESACSAGAMAIGNNLDWVEAQWHNRNYLGFLLDADVPLRPMALLLLALGLAAKEPGESGLAIDISIAAIDDGRLDGQKLGVAMRPLLTTGLIKCARWAKALTSVSQYSPLHAEVVRVALDEILRDSVDPMPRDLHALVELLLELVVESRSAVSDDVRTVLSSLPSSGKAGKAAKTILKVVPEVSLSREELIQRRLIEGRLARAERWKKC
jgi:hypothetical protein